MSDRDKSISPLRRRMIEDMSVRGFTPKTQTGYIRAVGDFTAYFGGPQDQAGAENLARARHLLAMPAPDGAAGDSQTVDPEEPPSSAYPCPSCGGPMIIIETFERGNQPRAPPIHGRGVDSP